MTQQDRDDAAELLRCAADDMLAGIRHIEGALLGAGHHDPAFGLACEAWYVTSQFVEEDSISQWCGVALEAAQLLEEGLLP